MTLTITPYGDNPWIPGETAYSYTPDQLIAGDHNLVTQPIVLGAGTLLRGTVLGLQTSFTAAATATAGNTGNGTVGSIVPGGSVQYGNPYVLTATSSTSFSVVDPEGVALGNATVGTAFNNGEIGFLITAGGTAFVIGDSFNILVTQGIGTFIASVRTASDGSQNPSAILVDNADASGGPVRTGAYVSGEFNVGRVIADSSWSIAQLTAAMRPFGIHLKSSVTGNDPLY